MPHSSSFSPAKTALRASAAVLAIFMGGLGAGGLVLGGRVDRSPHPLRFYARLELTIAAFTASVHVFQLVASHGSGGSNARASAMKA